MHVIIEFLPVLFGLLIAGLSRRLRPVFFQDDACLFLCLIAGMFVNWLSGEGVELVMLDIATTAASTAAFGVLLRVISAGIRIRA